jgi:competence protein ComFC
MTTSGGTRTSCFAWRCGSSALRAGRRALECVAAALFPPRCALCSCEQLALRVVCCTCASALPALDGPRCRRCGELVDDVMIDLCLRCGTRIHEVDQVFSLGPYEGGWGRLVRVFKFEREMAVGRWLGERLAAALARQDDDRLSAVVTFVPMSAHDGRARGFNQAEILARVLARRRNLPLKRLLAKTRETRPQSTLHAAERETNVCGAFRLLRPVQGRVLLVDDIYTTGSTVEECARVLKRGGARSVVAVTVARA